MCYDTPKTFRSYVQTKGRARMKESQYVIMAKAAENCKLQKKAAEWQQINQILRDVSSFWNILGMFVVKKKKKYNFFFGFPSVFGREGH